MRPYCVVNTIDMCTYTLPISTWIYIYIYKIYLIRKYIWEVHSGPPVCYIQTGFEHKYIIFLLFCYLLYSNSVYLLYLPTVACSCRRTSSMAVICVSGVSRLLSLTSPLTGYSLTRDIVLRVWPGTSPYMHHASLSYGEARHIGIDS